MKTLTNSEIASKLNITVESGEVTIQLKNKVIVTNKISNAKHEVYAVTIKEKPNGKTSVVLNYDTNSNGRILKCGTYYDCFCSKERKEILKELGL